MNTKLIFLTVAAGLLVFVSCKRSGLPASPPAGAIVIFKSGEAQLTRNGKAENLKIGDPIQAADILSTAATGRVTLQLNTPAVIRLQPDTLVVFQDLVQDEKAKLSLEKGDLLVSVRRQRVKAETFTVTTPTATASVRGTAFRAAIFENRTRFIVDAGKLAISLFDKEKFLSEGEGLEIEVRPDGTRTVIERAISGEERLNLERVVKVPVVDDPAARLDELKQAASSLETTTDEKIKDLARPLPLPELKKKFGHLDKLILADGREIDGVVAETGKEYVVLTPWGVIKVPREAIRKHTVER